MIPSPGPTRWVNLVQMRPRRPRRRHHPARPAQDRRRRSRPLQPASTLDFSPQGVIGRSGRRESAGCPSQAPVVGLPEADFKAAGIEGLPDRSPHCGPPPTANPRAAASTSDSYLVLTKPPRKPGRQRHDPPGSPPLNSEECRNLDQIVPLPDRLDTFGSSEARLLRPERLQSFGFRHLGFVSGFVLRTLCFPASTPSAPSPRQPRPRAGRWRRSGRGWRGDCGRRLPSGSGRGGTG